MVELTQIEKGKSCVNEKRKGKGLSQSGERMERVESTQREMGKG